MLSCRVFSIFLVSVLLFSLCFIIQANAESAWNIQTVDVAARESVSLSLDSNDDPHIAYTVYTNNDYRSSTNVTYARWNGSAWDIQTLDSNYFGTASLALDSFNNPHISYIYSTPTSSYVKHTSWTGSNWNNQTVDTSFTSSFRLGGNSLALDSNNNPHISYSERSDLNTTLKYASWTGSNWSIQTIDSEVPSSDFYEASIILDSNNYPHVVYGEGNVIYGTAFNNESNVKYAEWNGQSWNIQTVFLNVSSFGNVALDSNGYPHFTYLVESSLRYASWDGSTWNTQNVDLNPLISNDSFLALDSDGNPHISYYKDPRNQSQATSLVYTYWTGSAWNIQTVDQRTNRGAGPIVLDSSGNPHICYPSDHQGKTHYREIKYASRPESTTTPSPSVPELLLWVVLPLIIIVAVVALAILTYLRKRAHKRNFITNNLTVSRARSSTNEIID